jgi:hypothetical protein
MYLIHVRAMRRLRRRLARRRRWVRHRRSTARLRGRVGVMHPRHHARPRQNLWLSRREEDVLCHNSMFDLPLVIERPVRVVDEPWVRGCRVVPTRRTAREHVIEAWGEDGRRVRVQWLQGVVGGTVYVASSNHGVSMRIVAIDARFDPRQGKWVWLISVDMESHRAVRIKGRSR